MKGAYLPAPFDASRSAPAAFTHAPDDMEAGDLNAPLASSKGASLGKIAAQLSHPRFQPLCIRLRRQTWSIDHQLYARTETPWQS